MISAIRGSREHIAAEIDDVDSPTVEEAFEKTTLSMNKTKVVKGKRNESQHVNKDKSADLIHSFSSFYDTFVIFFANIVSLFHSRRCVATRDT